MSSRRVSGLIFGVAAVFFVATALKLKRWLLFVGFDLRDYVLPWYAHILAHGRWRSMEASYANYSPPYLYLLSGVSLLNGWVPAAALVKLAVVPFVVLAAVAAWWICRAMGCDRMRCWAGAVLVAFLPEVVLNCWKWGQCDIIHTSLLLVCGVLFLRGERRWVMLVLGAALAVKLQVIFAGPAVVALLVAGEIPWLSVLLVPVGYLLMLVPANLAGRPWAQLWNVYGGQYTYFNMLSMGAPNPYVLLQWTGVRQERMVSDGGILLAAVASACLIGYFWKHPRLRGAEGFLLLMTSSLLVLPYLLPKMHERYFFAGNCFLVVLAMRRPWMAVPAGMLQVSAVLTYVPFLNGGLATTQQLLLPLVLETVGIGWVLWAMHGVATGKVGREKGDQTGGLRAESGLPSRLS